MCVVNMVLTKVAFVGVEPDGKAVNISGSIGRATASCNSRESNEHWRFLLRIGKE